VTIEFYDLKLRKKVQIPKGNVTKVKIVQKSGQTRFAFRAVTDDGRKLMKFCSKADWETTDVPEA
jgi:hypothetical protein